MIILRKQFWSSWTINQLVIWNRREKHGYHVIRTDRPLFAVLASIRFCLSCRLATSFFAMYDLKFFLDSSSHLPPARNEFNQILPSSVDEVVCIFFLTREIQWLTKLTPWSCSSRRLRYLCYTVYSVQSNHCGAQMKDFTFQTSSLSILNVHAMILLQEEELIATALCSNDKVFDHLFGNLPGAVLITDIARQKMITDYVTYNHCFGSTKNKRQTTSTWKWRIFWPQLEHRVMLCIQTKNDH